MKKQYFDKDTYYSGGEITGRKKAGRIKRSRLVFTLRFLGVVFRSRKHALRGTYDWNQWSKASIDILRMLEDSGAEFNIAGLDNIRSLDSPVVFVSNHMSALETMVFPCLIAPLIDVTFVVKESLVSYPFFGPIMRSRDPIVVSRNNSREDLMVVLNDGAETLRGGTSVIIFPQSTRREYFKVSEFNSLGVKLAQKNNVNVVPVAIRTDYWKNGKVVKDLGPLDRSKNVYIEFGEPIDTSGKGRIVHNKVIDFIVSRLKKWDVPVED